MVDAFSDVESGVARMICEAVRYSFGGILLLCQYELNLLGGKEQLVIYGPLTFPCNVFKSDSRFLTVASATGTETAAPIFFPVAGSTNRTLIDPRSSGIVSISCCSLAFLASAVHCRLLGGGIIVAMADTCADLRL